MPSASEGTKEQPLLNRGKWGKLSVLRLFSLSFYSLSLSLSLCLSLSLSVVPTLCNCARRGCPPKKTPIREDVKGGDRIQFSMRYCERERMRKGNLGALGRGKKSVLPTSYRRERTCGKKRRPLSSNVDQVIEALCACVCHILQPSPPSLADE